MTGPSNTGTNGTAPTAEIPLAEKIPVAERLTSPKPDNKPEPPADNSGEETSVVARPRRDPASRLVATTLSLCGLLTIGVGGGAYFLLQQAAESRTLTNKRHTLLAATGRLDETLSSATRLYAATREERYLTRHGAAAAQILEALKDLNQLAAPKTPESESISAYAAAIKNRLALERRTMDWVRSGRQYEASTFLQNSTYEKSRAESARAATVFHDAAQHQAQAALAQQQQAAFGVGIAGIAALGMLGVAGRTVNDARRRWRTAAYEHQITLQKTQEELRQTKQQLDSKSRQLRYLSETTTSLELKIQRSGEKVDRQLVLLEAAVESAKDVVMIAEADAGIPRIIRVNKAFREMTGYEPHEILGRSAKMLQGPETDSATLEYLHSRLQAKQPAQVELLNYRKDGTPFWAELNIQPMFNEQGHLTYWISIQRDVTERRKAAEKIEWQAKHDALTELPNRTYYQELLAKAVAESEEKGGMVGVLFFDLDRFKQVNDTLGHLSGDRLLQEVAYRLGARLEGRDVIARVGGDEFTILLPGLQNPSKASLVAQELLDALNDSFYVDDQELYVTASIGISIAPQDGKDITTLLQNADIAMYQAKEQGRAGFRVYNDTMRTKALDPFHIETHLRRMLERGEIEEQMYLLYQPQVNVRTGKLFGVEALIRWENPVLGRVSPMQFIPVAEETGLIKPIGEWVMREACRQAMRWKKQGRLLRMSVNLSGRQFADKELLANLRDILRETGLPADLLDIELTESTLAQGAAIVETLQKIKAMGIYLSVDDFGTGYSSLSYIHTMPLDVLKIDKAFVQGMTQDKKSETLVRTLITLAGGVGMEVIAEGVETEAQKIALLEMGCHDIQGYLFSPPIKAADIDKMTDFLPQLCLVSTENPTPQPEIAETALRVVTDEKAEKPKRTRRKVA